MPSGHIRDRDMVTEVQGTEMQHCTLDGRVYFSEPSRWTWTGTPVDHDVPRTSFRDVVGVRHLHAAVKCTSLKALGPVVAARAIGGRRLHRRRCHGLWRFLLRAQ